MSILITRSHSANVLQATNTKAIESLFSAFIFTGYESSLSYFNAIKKGNREHKTIYASYIEKDIECYDTKYQSISFGGEDSTTRDIHDIEAVLGEYWYYDHDSIDHAVEAIDAIIAPESDNFDNTVDLDCLTIVDESYFYNETF